MTSWWTTLLLEQERLRFADVAGASAAIRLPLSDRLLSRILQNLASDWPVRMLDVHALGSNELVVHFRLKRPAILPSFGLRFRIERQAELPASPVVVLRLIQRGIGMLAGPLLRVLGRLPNGVDYRDDFIVIDLRSLASRYHLDTGLTFVNQLEFATSPGYVVISANVAVPSPDET
jgi:hypothetical protein